LFTSLTFLKRLIIHLIQNINSNIKNYMLYLKFH
jgi:hypothetical protein